MSTRFRVNKKGIAELKALPGVRAYTTAVADVGANVARAVSPIDTGQYRRSIGARQTGRKYARARVFARDFKAWWIEYGAGPSPVRGGRPFAARHTLATGIKATGVRYRDLRGG